SPAVDHALSIVYDRDARSALPFGSNGQAEREMQLAHICRQAHKLPWHDQRTARGTDCATVDNRDGGVRVLRAWDPAVEAPRLNVDLDRCCSVIVRRNQAGVREGKFSAERCLLLELEA